MLAALVLTSFGASAHRQNESYTTLSFNQQNGNLEVAHRFYLHDAEHALKQTIGKAGNITLDEALQSEFSDYLLSNFVLKDDNDKVLELDTVGFESDGKFLWVYQERPALDTRELKVKHTAMQEIYPKQVNQINLEKDGVTNSVRTTADKEWYSLSMPDSSSLFFANLASLCGTSYKGEMTFPDDGMDAFAGKLLVAKFAECSEKEVRVPFIVGDDHSRTWIFSKNADGILFKHDHCHEDGTPDEQTNYGGQSTNVGSAIKQSFPADEFTAKLIPAAATNVWNVSLNKDKTILTYHLTRHGKPRFTAVLYRDDFSDDLKKEVN